jgi:hypothetical protein
VTDVKPPLTVNIQQLHVCRQMDGQIIIEHVPAASKTSNVRLLCTMGPRVVDIVQ